MAYIHTLRAKPEAVKKQILYVSLISIMAVVVFIWVYSLEDHFSSDQTAANTDATVKPFTLFANSIASTYDNISASVGKITSKKEADAPAGKQIDLIVVDHPTNQ
jgi:hypothetical protein